MNFIQSANSSVPVPSCVDLRDKINSIRARKTKERDADVLQANDDEFAPITECDRALFESNDAKDNLQDADPKIVNSSIVDDAPVVVASGSAGIDDVEEKITRDDLGIGNHENMDNSNPKWRDVVKMFENNKHELLKYRWNTSKLANPKHNLTVLSHAQNEFGHRLRFPLTMDSPVKAEDTENQENSERLNDAQTIDVGDHEPPAKRPRREICSIIVDKVLDDLDKRLNVLRMVLAGKKREAVVGGLAGNGRIRHGESMKMMRRTKKYKKMVEQRQINNFIEESRLYRAMDGLCRQIEHLTKTRYEMQHFHRFYDHMDCEVSFLDECELDDLLETECVLGSYRDIYGTNVREKQ